MEKHKIVLEISSELTMVDVLEFITDLADRNHSFRPKNQGGFYAEQPKPLTMHIVGIEQIPTPNQDKPEGDGRDDER